MQLRAGFVACHTLVVMCMHLYYLTSIALRVWYSYSGRHSNKYYHGNVAVLLEDSTSRLCYQATTRCVSLLIHANVAVGTWPARQNFGIIGSISEVVLCAGMASLSRVSSSLTPHNIRVLLTWKHEHSDATCYAQSTCSTATPLVHVVY